MRRNNKGIGHPTLGGENGSGVAPGRLINNTLRALFMAAWKSMQPIIVVKAEISNAAPADRASSCQGSELSTVVLLFIRFVLSASPDELSALDKKVAPATGLSPYGRGNMCRTTPNTVNCPCRTIRVFEEIQPNIRSTTAGANKNRRPRRIVFNN